MNTHGALGLTAILILVTILFVGATATSVLLNQSNSVTKENLTQIIDTVATKYSTYLQIEGILGQYSMIDTHRQIGNIAILIEPLVTANIDLSSMVITLNTGDTVQILRYNGNAKLLQTHHSLFSHPQWETISNNTYSALSIHDLDNSLVAHNILNDHADLTYLIIKTPEEIHIKNGDQLSITFLIPNGIIRTITLDIPFSTKNVVSLL
ncbi:MAG: hypothetical protein QXX20_02525 [Candidatus Thermoplasmatota archaeon]